MNMSISISKNVKPGFHIVVSVVSVVSVVRKKFIGQIHCLYLVIFQIHCWYLVIFSYI